MATALVHIRVRPGTEARFERLARDMYAASHTTEATLRRYEYWRGAEERTYYALESFDDYAGFVNHQASDHHVSAAPQFREMFEEIHLEWVDPVQGASPLVATEGLALRDAATDVEADAFARHPVSVQDWWVPLR